jgi:hypothetical protein
LETLKEKRTATSQKVGKHQAIYPSGKKKGGNSRIIFILLCGLVFSLYMLSKTPSNGAKEPNQAIPNDVRQKKQNTLLFEEVVKRNIDGSYRLHPKRSEKLHRDTVNLESSEQYALKATTSKYYPCLSCSFRDSIFLYQNEVWKYGTTINGQVGRYGNSLYVQSLYYVAQYRGTIEECLKWERKKIIRYPLLPENLKRKNPIARPPGNPNDN